MDPTLAPLITLILQNGVPGLLLVILVFMVRHHLSVLKEHQEEKEAVTKQHEAALTKAVEDQRELEKELRGKIEELLKDQLETQKPLTEALVEYNRLVKRLDIRRNPEYERE